MVYLLFVIFFKRYAPFFLDLVLIQCALALSYLARSIVEFPWFERAVRSYLSVAPWYTGVQLFLLYVFELYEPARSRYRDYLDILPRVVKAVSLGTVMLVFIAFFSREFYLPRSIVLLGWLFNVLLLTGWRWGHLWISQRRRSPKRVLIYGTGALAELVRDEILRRPALKLSPVGFVRSPAEPETSRVEPILGTLGDFQHLIREKNVDEVIYAPDKRSNEELRVLVEQCEQVRVDAQIAPDLFEIVTGRVHLEHFGLPFLDPVTIASHRAYLRLKRLFDVAASCLVLIFLSPLMALIALAIKLDSPGPVLFRQRRVGKDGKEFTLYKFRTMSGEPETPDEMLEEDLARLTSVGRFLRLTRLDELPQLFNVLRGEMSLVGPRAECVALARKMAREIPYFEERLRVRPGMTGWAQVEFKYTTSVEEYRRKLQYDLYYIKNMSFSLDIIILVKTLWVVLTGKGAR
jgi:exopolysaccharide biosynthesis polyprenyl glycosylphosphotransferase